MRAQWTPLALIAAMACSDSTGTDVLQAPSSLSSVSLDRGIALTWSDNAFTANPDLFKSYRVYSTSYDLDNDVCGANWDLEGTTVAPEFLVGALTNGAPRCFSVTAATADGTESARSPIRADTPRPDARNEVLYARQVQSARSGFRFWDDDNNDGVAQDSEIGLVRLGSDGSIDFFVDRHSDGSLWLTPVRDSTGVELYSNDPVTDLTSIDFAADIDYSPNAIEAVPGFGYVFEMSGGDGFKRYAAMRVTHVGSSLIIFDWAYQTDPGNPELKVGGPGVGGR